MHPDQRSTLFFRINAEDGIGTPRISLPVLGDFGKLLVTLLTLASTLALLRFAAHKMVLLQELLDNGHTHLDVLRLEMVSNLLVREIGPLDLGVHGVPVAKEPKTSIRASAGNAVEKNEGYFP
jgi:hypothetical protein